jgi:UPF0755 protein
VARRRRRKPRNPTPKPRRRIGGWVALALGIVAMGVSTWLFIFYPSGRGPGTGRAIEIEVPPDVTPASLATLLAAQGLVTSPRFFSLWVRATGGTHAVAPGKHLLTDDASPRQLMARLERRPGGGSVRVTFPEGWTRFDMAKRLQDKEVCPLRDFLEATTDAALLQELGIQADSAEGFLFPATYDLLLDSDAADIVRRMKHEFDRRWDILSRGHQASLNDVMTSTSFSIRDVLILASMVEKEAAVDDERPLVASVFLNRLRDPAFTPKRLECDPTAVYGCIVAPERATSCATFTGKATAPIEHDPDNPYSTYTHEGLPPGPIANPGAKAIEAVMSPANTRFLYFVAKGDGRSVFSETYDAHAAAVRAAGHR